MYSELWDFERWQIVVPGRCCRHYSRRFVDHNAYVLVLAYLPAIAPTISQEVPAKADCFHSTRFLSVATSVSPVADAAAGGEKRNSLAAAWVLFQRGLRPVGTSSLE